MIDPKTRPPLRSAKTDRETKPKPGSRIYQTKEYQDAINRAESDFSARATKKFGAPALGGGGSYKTIKRLDGSSVPRR